ncbi:YraN family protein [Thermobispora bispora]|jgi:putative endonuclease|uniref:UPF0102 protein Tbis_0992 n=1 Tax=Thermobispora bispora (strain ATCC 19993 / DSM 43833 / CBS 139.67 / JCM 10125 / KCTC 9307 / NBRC 14880 / R51) TaxID=469371 RepID=D6Y7C0_THEBD|nr:YraN family protein [Thermobispora bispora]MBO2473053.1 YraN family protein [Actinomycetales bacterium]MDI9579567.1 YraN family protein [Thermobispora sp.]ADG87715.1 protein of unknown function UPF0102 [Thermobispora bispora DSM 43833]MBX6169465.1 YraN family protein [Thermobispora bispora]QSI47622.1 YraN family protein [Thermobispora bispora]
MAAKDRLGRDGERVAEEYLRAEGMRILARNWRCREGEIDILAQDGSTLVVVEVKTRSGRSHGTAFEAVTPAKLRRLRMLAARWLAAQGERFDAVRIDVVALERFAGDFAIRHERGVC